MGLPSYSKGYTPPKAGVQNPGKYPVAPGKNYAIWGEQPGWIYDPYSDVYRADKGTQTKYYQDQGLIEADPKSPGLASSVLPLAVVAAGTALASEGGKALVGGAKDVVSGLVHGSAATGTNVASGAGAAPALSADEAAFQNLGSMPGATDTEFLGGLSAEGGAASTEGLSDAASVLGTGPQQYIVPGIGAALGAYGVYNATQAGNKKAGITSGVLSGAGMGASIGSMIPGLGTVAGAAIGAGIGLLGGAMAHESTNDRTTRRYGELPTSDNAAFEEMKKKGLEGSLAGVDTWDIGQDKSQAPIDYMVNSYGVLKTFGPEWTTLSDDQRKQIVTGMVDQDLINSKQGEYLVDNPEAAQKIKADVLARTGGAAGGVTQQTAAVTNNGTVAPPPTDPGPMFNLQNGMQIGRGGLVSNTPAATQAAPPTAPITASPIAPPQAPVPPPPIGGLLGAQALNYARGPLILPQIQQPQGGLVGSGIIRLPGLGGQTIYNAGGRYGA